MIGSVSRTDLPGTGAEHAEVQHDDNGDEDPQEEKELALRDEVGLAGFIDQLRDFPHGAVHRQVLQPRENRHAEQQAEDANHDAKEEQFVAVDAQEGDLRKIRELEPCFARRFFRGPSAKARCR